MQKKSQVFSLNWYETKRFSAEVLKSEFEGKYEDFFKTDFHVKPAFIVPESNDQLGIYSHVLDAKQTLDIIEKIDVNATYSVKSLLKKLYHASAESVAKTLNEFLQSSISSNKKNTTSSSRPSPPAGDKSGSSSTGSDGVATDASYSPFAKIIADERSNGIFMTGTEADLERLSDMIDKLDTPLPMARIDTIFIMIDLTSTSLRGIDALFRDLEWNNNEAIEEEEDGIVGYNGDGNSYLGTKPLDSIPEGTTPVYGKVKVPYTVPADSLSGGLSIPGLNSGVEFELENWKLQKIKWGQIFSAASERKDVRVFSTPSITVIHGGGEDGEKGGSDSKIEIMDTRTHGQPYYFNSYRPTPGDEEEGRNLTDRSAKTELSISNPRIKESIYNSDGSLHKRGTVFMSVEITAEKFDDTNTNVYDGQELPSIKSRYAKTNLAIRDGQIMVLGGLQEVQLDITETKYNFLSDIPYFGKKFFTPKNQRYTPTELLIFIRPTIIDPDLFDDEEFLNNEISETEEMIDIRMESEYNPVFESPSEKILGVSEHNGDHKSKGGGIDKTSKPDEKSSPPPF